MQRFEELGTTATIYPIKNVNQVPVNLLKFLAQEYNDEISRGDSLPFFEQLSFEEFRDYWFGQFAGIMIIGEEPELNDNLTVKEWSKLCLGSFFIKSAYPGRCSHICTTNFLVNAGIRRHGIGFFMCECFVRWAPILGYSRCIVELVFETNIGGKRLLEKCGFTKVGKVNGCAILKSTKDLLINAFIYTKQLQIIEDDHSITSKHSNILRYLLSGQYPENSTREDKSRLRSLAYHYEVINNKLYLRGKEVISEPDDQIQITRKIHTKEHMGINRTLKAISGKYYWSKMKATVKKVVDECDVCKNNENPNRKLGRTKKKKISESQESNINSNLDSIYVTQPQQVRQNVNDIQNATRLDTEPINTPEDLILRQSENTLMNLIGYQPQKNISNRDMDNPVSHSNSDYSSILNYYAENKSNNKRAHATAFQQSQNYGNQMYYTNGNNLFAEQNYNEEDDDDYDESDDDNDDDDDEEDDEEEEDYEGEGEDEAEEVYDEEDDYSDGYYEQKSTVGINAS
ncbi:hypothetical protein CANINC_003606, partial [Pichia inconspicua]